MIKLILEPHDGKQTELTYNVCEEEMRKLSLSLWPGLM